MLWLTVVGVNWLTSCRSAAGKCYGPIIVPPIYTSELFYILENKLIGYADDSILIAVVPSPGLRVTVAESMMLWGTVAETFGG